MKTLKHRRDVTGGVLNVYGIECNTKYRSIVTINIYKIIYRSVVKQRVRTCAREKKREKEREVSIYRENKARKLKKKKSRTRQSPWVSSETADFILADIF